MGDIHEINNENLLIENKNKTFSMIECSNEDTDKEEHLEGLNMEDPDENIIEELEIELIEKKSKKSCNNIKSSTTKKRVSLTIEKKIEIIQRHEKGESQKSLSVEFNVGRTTISDILKRKYKFFKVKNLYSCIRK